MDFIFQLQFVAVLIAFVSLYHLWIERIMSKKTKTKEPPKPSGSLPIIGHLHLLRKRRPLAQVFREMADKHGPVFMIHLGMRRTLVVNSCEAAKECLSTNDKVFATRPGSAAGKHMGYNYAMVGFAPYGSYWRSVRKIIMVELLSNARLETLKHVRSTEIDTCMRELHELWLRSNRRPVKVEMKQWLGALTYNIIVRALWPGSVTSAQVQGRMRHGGFGGPSAGSSAFWMRLWRRICFPSSGGWIGGDMRAR